MNNPIESGRRTIECLEVQARDANIKPDDKPREKNDTDAGKAAAVQFEGRLQFATLVRA